MLVWNNTDLRVRRLSIATFKYVSSASMKLLHVQMGACRVIRQLPHLEVPMQSPSPPQTFSAWGRQLGEDDATGERRVGQPREASPARNSTA